jgi:hypothetical protein
MVMSHCDPNGVDQINDHLDRVISTFRGQAIFKDSSERYFLHICPQSPFDSVGDDADNVEDIWEEEEASLANGIGLIFRLVR